MKKMNKSLMFSSAIASGILLASMSTVSHAGAEAKMEKCYGISKAGKNDCGIKSQGTSCAGQAKEDGISDAFILVPKGTCDKIVGGSTEPK